MLTPKQIEDWRDCCGAWLEYDIASMALAFAQLVEVAKEAKNQKSFFSDHYEGPDTYCCCKLEDALWSQDPIAAVAALHKEASDASQ